jgi:DNA modification methylase
VIDDPDVRVLLGDARERLSEFDADSAQCLVTSPPFWNLRDYGTGEWHGGSPDCDHKRPAGSLGGLNGFQDHWISAEATAKKVEGYGRVSYAGACGRCGATRLDSQIGLEETPEEWVESLVDVMRAARRVLRPDGVAWIEVGDTYADRASTAEKGASTLSRPVPRKTNALVNGRKAKDLVGAPWMLAFALRADGWYLRSDTIWHRPNPMPESVTDRPTKAHSYVFLLSRSDRYFYDADAIREPNQPDGRRATKIAGNGAGVTTHENYANRVDAERWPNPLGANARSVWSIPPQSSAIEHFAMMPEALAARCIAAGSRVGDVVLDPFMGSGTTALVARRMGRLAIGCELSADFLALSYERLAQQSLFA